MDEKFYITPNTNLWELSERFPTAETIVAEYFPDILKLKNIKIKKSVLSALTLDKIALQAKVACPDIVNLLRKKLQINDSNDNYQIQENETKSKINGIEPSWLIRENIVQTIDARPIIMAGGHPLEEAIKIVNNLKSGEIFELVAPFVPEPMIDMFTEKGLKYWHENKNGSINTYFCK